MIKHLRRRVKKRGRGLVVTGIVILLLASAAFFVIKAYPNFFPEVTEELVVETGSPLPTVVDFLTPVPDKVVIVEGLDQSVDMNVPGDHTVIMDIYGRQVSALLRVVDTTAPTVTVKDVESYPCTEMAVEEFVTSVYDLADVTVSYDTQPDLIAAGEKEVRIVVTDTSGNTTVATAKLTILADDEAPVITGVKELSVEIGGSVSYKNGVTVTDNSGVEVKLEVDNDSVDLNQLGDYVVTYRARDLSGNVTEEKTILHVITPLAEGVSEEAIYAAADEILAKILKPDMTPKEVIKAIYNWSYWNIRYVDSSSKDNWIQGAYSGLVQYKGDCYVYAMATKCLLTRAGITNMIISKIPGRTLHYWNLVDIGEGWHHLDTTPRKDGSRFFYLTDSELMAYSDAHNGTHHYDREQYPEIQ